MITLGVILLIVGFIIKFPVLWSIGIIVLVIGLVLVALGAMGRAATRFRVAIPAQASAGSTTGKVMAP